MNWATIFLETLALNLCLKIEIPKLRISTILPEFFCLTVCFCLVLKFCRHVFWGSRKNLLLKTASNKTRVTEIGFCVRRRQIYELRGVGFQPSKSFVIITKPLMKIKGTGKKSRIKNFERNNFYMSVLCNW